MNKKLIRITTVPMALRYLLPGQMQFMQQNGFDVLMISADGKEREEVIQSEGCRHLPVPMTRQITPLQDLKCLFQLIKIFRKEKPDIVHTHTPKAGLLGMIAAKVCFVKIRIHTVAGLPLMVEKGMKYRVLKLIEKITYAAANQVWPNSYSLKNFILEQRMVQADKVHVIARGSSNGVNLDRFNKNNLDHNVLSQLKTSLNYHPENIYLLCIGRLVFDKGIVELVTAFNQLKKKHAKLFLILVGDFETNLDPLPLPILNEIKSNAAIIHIKWSDKVEYYMTLSHYFVFASHREGFPNVILQAAAMELPVICSKIPGNIDIVQHNETGLIFNKANIDELVANMEYAFSHSGIMKSMAVKLHDQIKDNYKREYIWVKVLEQYQTLMY